MAIKISSIRKKFMERRDKHGVKMKMALTRLGHIFKIKKYN